MMSSSENSNDQNNQSQEGIQARSEGTVYVNNAADQTSESKNDRAFYKGQMIEITLLWFALNSIKIITLIVVLVFAWCFFGGVIDAWNAPPISP